MRSTLYKFIGTSRHQEVPVLKQGVPCKLLETSMRTNSVDIPAMTVDLSSPNPHDDL